MLMYTKYCHKFTGCCSGCFLTWISLLYIIQTGIAVDDSSLLSHGLECFDILYVKVCHFPLPVYI